MAILSTVTQYVQVAKLKSGGSMPVIKGEETDATVVLVDLSKTPPEQKQFTKDQLGKYETNATWKHPPASAQLTNQELADVIAYLRFVAKGDRKGVDPAEVQ